jgi:hypothetical protein
MAMRESIMKEGIMTPIWQRGYLQGDGSVIPEPGLGGLIGMAMLLPFAIGKPPEVAFALVSEKEAQSFRRGTGAR